MRKAEVILLHIVIRTILFWSMYSEAARYGDNCQHVVMWYKFKLDSLEKLFKLRGDK
jgi:hypothetical protein